MRRFLQTSSLLAPLALLVAGSASADKIYLADGTILSGVDVQSEKIDKVQYKPKDGGRKEEVDAELVLKVEYSEKPAAFQGAEYDFKDKAFLSAVDEYGNYLENLRDKPDKDHPWAPAAAQFRIAHIHKVMLDKDGLTDAVAALEAKFADSRYLPEAMVALADLHRLLGDKGASLNAVKAIEEKVKTGAFPSRWDVEAKVRRALVDGSLKGESLERELDRLAKGAAAFPSARAVALAERARLMTARGAAAEAADSLRDVIAKTSASDEVMAAAYTALGAALFADAEAKREAGDREDAIATYGEARLALMRVVVSYKFEGTYVAESAYLAGRCFVEIKDEGAADNARSLFRFVIRNFRGSDWADKSIREDRKL